MHTFYEETSSAEPIGSPLPFVTIVRCIGISFLFLTALGVFPFSKHAPFPACLPQKAQAATPVKLQLHWTHQFEFAGYYAALKKGFFEEEGLDVTILEGGPGIIPIELLQKGEVDIIAGNSEILLARLDKKPVVAIAAIFQHSAATLVTLAKSTNHAPQDLIGKTVEMGRRISDAEMYAMFSNEGLTSEQYQHIDSTFSLSNLITGKVDAVSAYISNQPFHLKELGIPYRLIRPVWFGIDFYGDLLATSEFYLHSNSKTVERFLRASVKGWEYAFAHPDEIINIILKDYRTATHTPSKAKLYYEFGEMRKLVMPDIIEIGHMNEARFRHMADTFISLGLADPGYSLKGFVWKPEQDSFDWSKGLGRNILGIILIAIIASLFLLFFFFQTVKRMFKYKENNQSCQQMTGQLSAALNGAGLGYWEWNHDTAKLFVNSRSAELLEIGNANTIISAENIKEKPLAKELVTHISQQIAEGFIQLEFDVATQSTGAHWLLCKGGIVQNDLNGSPHMAAGVLYDNTMLKNYQEELEELSITDFQTGVYNRRYLTQQLELHMETVRDGETSLCLALIEIDKLKNITKQFGEANAEMLLKETAWKLRAPLREYDIIARYGDSTFVIFFVDVKKQHALKILQELRNSLANHTFTIDETSLSLTISAGVIDSAELPAVMLEPPALLAEATKRLYVAKEKGRDSIISE